MCDFIESACLMANLFVTCKERKSFRLHDVRTIGDEVEKRLRDQNVMVLWTRPSLLAAMHDYSDMFIMRGREVIRSEASEDLFTDDFVDEEFNSRLPASVVSGMREVIQTTCAVM